MTKNKMAWESWNAKEEEMIESKDLQHKNLLTELTQNDITYEEDAEMSPAGDMIEVTLPQISTPFGSFSTNSIFKPSDRWECWIGHTNFVIGPKCFKILNESIPGIEALSIMGSYTFCIGVAKLFDAADVKRQIEQTFCGEINVQGNEL